MRADGSALSGAGGICAGVLGNRHFGQKCGRGQDFDSLERAQGEEVVIAGDDCVGHGRDAAHQDGVVVGIAADGIR